MTPLRIAISVCATIALALLPAPAAAQAKKLPELVKLETRVLPEDPFDPANDSKFKGNWKARRGESVRLELTGTLTPTWYTYPVLLRMPQQFASNTWINEPAKGVTPIWPLLESPPHTYVNKALEKTYFTYDKTFTWIQEVAITENAPVGLLQVPIKLKLQICDPNQCLNFDHVVTFSIDVSAEPPVPISAALAERIKNSVAPGEKAVAKDGGGSVLSAGLIRDSHEQYKQKMEKIAELMVVKGQLVAQQDDSDLLTFILAGIFWGAISLVTPCVFPMIPITVSFFLKQSEKEHHRPVVMAGVYSFTIVIVLTLAAAFFLGAFRLLSVHPVTNVIIGGLFIYFALSLFGMYEIKLPDFLARLTSEGEKKGGLAGTISMALTFTIISFACVAPFLGGFGGTAAGNRIWWHNLLGGLAFAATFASPFFFLALFPALLRKLPKSGSWLVSVKVVMGFLEFAAAFKFFRMAELIPGSGKSEFLTFDLILALWIGLCVLCALYLIGLFRLPHDSPEEHIGVPRLIFSAAFLGLALYLTPALFKADAAGKPQRPRGAVYSWVESFLLPDSEDGDDTANLSFAIEQARAEFQRTGKPKRIFIDFTGVTCTNCMINEKTVFSKPNIHKLFEPYFVVKLFTDTVPLDYYASEMRDGARAKRDATEVNLKFQKKLFDTEQLPLYVVLEPQLDGKVHILGVYIEGRINNEGAFAEFLKDPK